MSESCCRPSKTPWFCRIFGHKMKVNYAGWTRLLDHCSRCFVPIEESKP